MLIRVINKKLHRVAQSVVAHYPRAGLTAVGIVASVGPLCGAWRPSPSLVRRAFDGLADLRPARVAAAAASSHWRFRSLIGLTADRGLDGVAELLEGPDDLAATLARHPTAVLVTWHIGPLQAIAAALHRLGGRTLIIRRLRPNRPPDNLETLETLSDRALGASALLRAIVWLREKGTVLIAADGDVHGSKIEGVPCLDRRLRFSRGPFFISRRAGVPLIPVLASWGARAGTLRVVVGEPLEPPPGSAIEVERDLALRCALWLEDQILRRPHEISLRMLENLARMPRSAEASGSRLPESFGPAAQQDPVVVKASPRQ